MAQACGTHRDEALHLATTETSSDEKLSLVFQSPGNPYILLAAVPHRFTDPLGDTVDPLCI